MKDQRNHRLKIKGAVVLALFLCGLHLGLQAQQDAQYTQYMYNTLAVNPAYAGTRGILGISALDLEH